MTSYTLIEGPSKKIPKHGPANTVDLVFACHDYIATNYITCSIHRYQMNEVDSKAKQSCRHG